MSETKSIKRLPAEKKEKLPLMIASFLLIPQHDTAQQNLMVFINALSETTKLRIYEICKQDLTARAERQILALKQQIETM